MEHKEVHQIIREFFVSSDRRIESDNQPCLVRRGTRGTLAACLGVAGLKFNRGVEVGTRWGVYAMELCKGNPDLHLTCVDPYERIGHLTQARQDIHYGGAIENLAPFNVDFIRKRSMDALDDIKDRSLDFVYVDGAHDFDNACPDIIFWAYKVRIGGIVAVHDYMAGHWAGVVKAVDAYTHCHEIKPWYVTRELAPTAFWVNPSHHGAVRPY